MGLESVTSSEQPSGFIVAVEEEEEDEEEAYEEEEVIVSDVEEDYSIEEILEEEFIEEVEEEEEEEEEIISDHEEEFVEEEIVELSEEEVVVDDKTPGNKDDDSSDDEDDDDDDESGDFIDDGSSVPPPSFDSSDLALYDDNTSGGRISQDSSPSLPVELIRRKKKEKQLERQNAAVNEGARKAMEEALARERSLQRQAAREALQRKRLEQEALKQIATDAKDFVHMQDRTPRQEHKESLLLQLNNNSARMKLIDEIRKVDKALAQKREQQQQQQQHMSPNNLRARGTVEMQKRKRALAELRRQSAREELTRNNNLLKAAKASRLGVSTTSSPRASSMHPRSNHHWVLSPQPSPTGSAPDELELDPSILAKLPSIDITTTTRVDPISPLRTGISVVPDKTLTPLKPHTIAIDHGSSPGSGVPEASSRRAEEDQDHVTALYNEGDAAISSVNDNSSEEKRSKPCYGNMEQPAQVDNELNPKSASHRPIASSPSTESKVIQRSGAHHEPDTADNVHDTHQTRQDAADKSGVSSPDENDHRFAPQNVLSPTTIPTETKPSQDEPNAETIDKSSDVSTRGRKAVKVPSVFKNRDEAIKTAELSISTLGAAKKAVSKQAKEISDPTYQCLSSIRRTVVLEKMTAGRAIISNEPLSSRIASPVKIPSIFNTSTTTDAIATAAPDLARRSPSSIHCQIAKKKSVSDPAITTPILSSPQKPSPVKVPSIFKPSKAASEIAAETMNISSRSPSSNKHAVIQKRNTICAPFADRVPPSPHKTSPLKIPSMFSNSMSATEFTPKSPKMIERSPVSIKRTVVQKMSSASQVLESNKPLAPNKEGEKSLSESGKTKDSNQLVPSQEGATTGAGDTPERWGRRSSSVRIPSIFKKTTGGTNEKANVVKTWHSPSSPGGAKLLSPTSGLRKVISSQVPLPASPTKTTTMSPTKTQLNSPSKKRFPSPRVSPVTFQKKVLGVVGSCGEKSESSPPYDDGRYSKNREVVDSVQSGSKYYSLEDLREKRVQGIDYSQREQYLSPLDFEKCFHVSKSDFAQFPKWKRDVKKRQLGLF